MKQRITLFIIALMAIATVAGAQTRQRKITGRLIDQSNKEPLPNAAVALLELDRKSVV